MDDRAHDGGEAGAGSGGAADVLRAEPTPVETNVHISQPGQVHSGVLVGQLPRAAGGGAGAVVALLATDPGCQHAVLATDPGCQHAVPDAVCPPAQPPPVEPAEPAAQNEPASRETRLREDAASFPGAHVRPTPPVGPDPAFRDPGAPDISGEGSPRSDDALEDQVAREPSVAPDDGVDATAPAVRDGPPEDGGREEAVTQGQTDRIGGLVGDAVEQPPLPTNADQGTSTPGDPGDFTEAPGAASEATALEAEAAPEGEASAAATLPRAAPPEEEKTEPLPQGANVPETDANSQAPYAPEPATASAVAELIPEVRPAASEGATLTPSVTPALRAPPAPVAAPLEHVVFAPPPAVSPPAPGPRPPPPPPASLNPIPPTTFGRSPATTGWPAPATAPPHAPPAAADAPASPRPRFRPGRARVVLRVAVIAILALAALQLGLLILYRWVDPPTSMVMLGQRLVGVSISQRWVPLERMSPNLFAAVISSEDGHFCRHHGVDWGELKEAIESAADGNARGGSTITMQVVKNVFLWPSRSYLRKAIEIPMAYAMELFWPKRRILEVYLNVAEWGPGIFGAEAAARYHFRKPALLLTPREAALLAVSLPNPIERQAGRPGPGTVRLADNLTLRLKASYPNTRCVRIRALDERAWQPRPVGMVTSPQRAQVSGQGR